MGVPRNSCLFLHTIAQWLSLFECQVRCHVRIVTGNHYSDSQPKGDEEDGKEEVVVKEEEQEVNEKM